MDFDALFQPGHVLELIIRGTVMYLMIYLLLRVVSRRELGETGATNILLVVLIADASQNGMAGMYTSVTDGIVLVATILAWSVLLDAAAYRWRWAARIIKPPAVLLVKDGIVLRRNLRRELITEDELWSQLRHSGIDSLDNVRKVLMETDGKISVITR